MADQEKENSRLASDNTHALRPHIENLVWGLFRKASDPPFDINVMGIGRVDEFVNCKETIDATQRYINELRQIYAKKNPGHQLNFKGATSKVTRVSRTVVVKNLSSNTEREMPMKNTQSVNEGRLVPTNANTRGSPSSVMEANQQHRPQNQPNLSQSSEPIVAGQEQSASLSPSVAAATPLDHPASETSPPGSSPLDLAMKPGKLPPPGSLPKKPVAPIATFQIPNAKVGVRYAGTIEGTDQAGKSVCVRSPIIPPSLGLLFDETTGEIAGIPATDGEQRITLQWSSDGISWHTGECLFFINPDPRSLWKNIEPPADDPYYKPNIDSSIIQTPSHSIIAASRRGRSHEHSGTFRDDDFFVAHDHVANWSVVVVADGAGSAKNSRRGSKLAVDAFGEHVKSQLSGDLGRKLSQDLAGWIAAPEAISKALGTDFHYLFHKAGTLAVEAIESEAQSNNASTRDYATTLLAAAARFEDDGVFLSTFWMGDGAISVYGPRGKVRLMGAPDGGEFAGQTRFLDRGALSDPNFAKRIGIGRYSELKAIMLMTDGVSDPRFETDAGLVNPLLWDQLWDELLPLVNSENPEKLLVEWLHFFTPGHHDDRTIAILALAQ